MLKIFPGLHPDPLKQSLGVGIRSMRAREYSETILLQGKTWEPLCENTFHQLCVECDAAAAKLLQSCPILCNPIDGSPPGSPVPGILQARTLEWVAISLSNAWKWKVKVKSLSHVRLFATPWTAAYQAPLSMGFSRQEYSSGVPLPSPWVWWGMLYKLQGVVIEILNNSLKLYYGLQE